MHAAWEEEIYNKLQNLPRYISVLAPGTFEQGYLFVDAKINAKILAKNLPVQK